jgi:hypothetical protein
MTRVEENIARSFRKVKEDMTHLQDQILELSQKYEEIKKNITSSKAKKSSGPKKR